MWSLKSSRAAGSASVRCRNYDASAAIAFDATSGMCHRSAVLSICELLILNSEFATSTDSVCRPTRLIGLLPPNDEWV